MSINRLILLVAASIACTFGRAESMANTRQPTLPELAPTPPMGWNSWDCFGMDVTEEQVKASADYMSKNLRAAGWEYIVVDMGWYYGEGLNTTNFKAMKNPPQYVDGYGRLIPSERKFPSAAHGQGLKPLADYVHGLGLKFGIHIMRGVPWQAVEQNLPIKGTNYRAQEILNPAGQCKWYDGLRGLDMTKSGAEDYYRSLVELYAQWGVDFIKADDMEKPYARRDIEAISGAIAEIGRPIVLGLSAGPVSVSEIAHLRTHTNMWRISGDMWDDWSFVKRQFEICRTWQDYVTPNHWPDCDILPIGRLRINGIDDVLAKAINKRPQELVNEVSRLTPEEQYSLLTLWYVFRSPLMMGGNLLDYDDRTLQMLTNTESLAVNQRGIGSRELRANNRESVWTSVDSSTGDRYIALFNLDDAASRKVVITWAELGLRGLHSVRDLWKKEDIGQFDRGFDALVAPHGAGLYRLHAP